ncbi:MAG TPA: GAF domain-containing sensor histidine kinase [Dictyobacter sp.]|jgi:signal transduction histidine kinase|nr:GAF domain-containing sensor histidine kinase [Dictyobacter sp.]
MISNVVAAYGSGPQGNNVLASQEWRKIDEVLVQTVQQASRLMDGAACRIVVPEQESGSLRVYATETNAVFSLSLIQTQHYIEYQVMTNGQPFLSNDCGQETIGYTEQPLTGSVFCVPLLYDARCLGALRIHCAQRDAFAPVAIQRLSAFAEQVSITIACLIEAREATRARATFLSMVAHELRSPLNAINGYLDLTLAGTGGELTEQQHEFIQRARAGSEHLYTLLEDLLLISRVDAGQMRLNKSIIYLPELVASAVEELELTAIDHGVSITIEIAENFPPLFADAIRLQQVLRNLISNALRFTPSTGKIIISAYIDQSGEESRRGEEELLEQPIKQVKLRIQDTGIGIPPEFHARIFERFFQVPGHNAMIAGGQGLGLAIVKKIVELHGGNVVVESAPAQGSSFICFLPCLFQ